MTVHDPSTCEACLAGFRHVGDERPAALAYIRVSSRAQDFATQRTAIERWATARGDVISHWRSEKKSAKTMDRPELAQLLADAKAGKLRGHRLYLFRLDRLTRSGIRDTLNALEETPRCRARGGERDRRVRSPGSHADVIISVMAWAAKMERLSMKERVSAARDRIEAAGGTWGRPARIDAKTLKRAQGMIMCGKTQRHVAMALRIPRSTLRDALRQGGKGSPAGDDAALAPPGDGERGQGEGG